VIGSTCLLLGILLPVILNVRTFRIYNILNEAGQARDVGLLIACAFLLVILNSLRALPIYLGSYLLCFRISKINKWLFRIAILLIVLAVYYLTGQVYDVYYDFGIPSVIVILMIYLLDGFNLETVKLYQRSIILICVLIGAQFLDVIPALSAYGFGRGIVSTDIKLLAEYFDKYNVLGIFCLSQVVVFLSMAALFSRLLMGQHKLLTSAAELAEARIQALEVRKNLELRHLVHDLKTPLTTIEALAGVCQMRTREEKIKDYQRRIIDSAESMGEMISQILEPHRTSPITLEEVFNCSMFQITSQRNKDMIVIRNNAADRYIDVNKITFSRALVNLINNAVDAVDPSSGRIWISTEANEGDITLTVQDNGCGISEKNIAKVWDAGFSTHGSTGLGMGYVKEAIDICGGSIQLESKLGEGTKITIRLKESVSNEAT